MSTDDAYEERYEALKKRRWYTLVRETDRHAHPLPDDYDEDLAFAEFVDDMGAYGLDGVDLDHLEAILNDWHLDPFGGDPILEGDIVRH
jgi:hypothetical protein